MKNLILLLTFHIMLGQYTISCNDDFLSKFHQNTFKIKDERIQLINYNKNVTNWFEIKAFKHNRTTTAHNVSFNLKIDVQDKIEVLVQCYKFLSNEYRHFPLRFQANFKKMFDKNVLGIKSGVKACGNIENAYFYKNITYYFCNFVIDATMFPPLIPNGKYRIDVAYLYLLEEIAFFYIYLEIYVPIEYPKY